MSRQQDEADLEAVEASYLGNGGEFLLGFLEERLVARGGYRVRSAGVAELRRMRIVRELQGQGYGGQLLKELEQRAFRAGFRAVWLETAKRRPLTLEFYRKHGYRESGQGFYGVVETVQFEKAL